MTLNQQTTPVWRLWSRATDDELISGMRVTLSTGDIGVLRELIPPEHPGDSGHITIWHADGYVRYYRPNVIDAVFFNDTNGAQLP